MAVTRPSNPPARMRVRRRAVTAVCSVTAAVPGAMLLSGTAAFWDTLATLTAMLGVVSRILLTWYRTVHREGRLDMEYQLRARRQQCGEQALKVALDADVSTQQRHTAQQLASLLIAALPAPDERDHAG